MKLRTIIIKIGGKILENKNDLNSTIDQIQLLLKEYIIQNVVIIPGGGTRANFVRHLDSEFNLGDDLSHWMAIYAMDLNGILIKEDYPFIKLIKDFNKLKNEICHPKNDQILVFQPYDYLKNKNPLPHSWNVTSDSITLHLAKKLGLNEIYLIKNVDGLMIKEGENIRLIKRISYMEYEKFLRSQDFKIDGKPSSEIKKSKPIDKYSLTLIKKYNIPCIILNGTKGKFRIQNYFKEQKEDDKYYSIIF
ncbi:MAG: hypothetical protein ACFFD2_30305 [Promethearchaeota archaeon]